MTTAARRHSTREVRALIRQALRRHFLPLMLALLILSLPLIAAGALDGLADACLLELRAEKEWLREQSLIPGWRDDPENKDAIMDAWLREGELESRAGSLDLAGDALSLIGNFLAMPLLFGVNLVLICSLRGGDYSWRDALISFGEFRRGVKMQCCILMLMLMLTVPGVLIRLLSSIICGGTGTVGLILEVAAALVTAVLFFIAQLRFHLAPRLLADGMEGTAGELIAKSTEILDNRSLLPQLSILFPGFLLVIAVWLLQAFALPLILPRYLVAPLGTLLSLPGYGYLITASAAIYVTFRTP